jgi:diphosphomevalonate decarboxylase
MIQVTAPSNIALIKYMGKSAVNGNRPTNASLSYTLNHLVTEIQLEASEKSWDVIEPLEKESFFLELSEKGQARFLAFFEVLKKQFRLQGRHFVIRSGNNFPSDCGLASSASSFAALTSAAHAYALKEGRLGQEMTPRELSIISQRGSGSSCRSFFSGFALWENEGAVSLDVGIKVLEHDVILLEKNQKEVSSSKAHLQVLTSLLFSGRAQRAENRLAALLKAFREGAWAKAYEICWEEFWDMHALFETARPSFGYMTPDSLKVLDLVRKFWKEKGDGPLVTMDAGPNVHWLFRRDQKDLRAELKARLREALPESGVLSS